MNTDQLIFFAQVPFSMRKVSEGSLNHQNVSDKVINNICHAKKVSNNAWDTVISKINDARKAAAVTPEELAAQKHRLLHNCR